MTAATRFLAVLLACLLAAFAASPAQAQTLRDDLLNAQDAPPDNPLRADGVVRTADGPAAGLEVLLEVSDMRIRRQIAYLSTRTDELGRFTFDLSGYKLGEFGLEFITRSPRYVSISKIFVVRREELPLEVELEVVPGAAAAGIVVDEQGRGIEGVRISTEGAPSVQTDREGRFELFGFPPRSRVSIRVSRKGYAEEFVRIDATTPGLVDVPPITLKSGEDVSARVVDPMGRPVGGGTLILNTPGLSQRQSVARDGTATFKAMPASLEGAEVSYTSDMWLPSGRPLTDDEVASRTLVVAVRPAVALGGKVSLTDGRPVAGATVTLRDGRGAARGSVTTSNEGRWIMRPFDIGETITLLLTPPDQKVTQSTGELAITPGSSPGAYSGEINPWPKGFRSTFDIRVEDGTVTMTRRDTGAGGFAGEVLYSGKLDPEKMRVEGTVRVPSIKAEGRFLLRKYNTSAKSMAGDWDVREEVTVAAARLAPVAIATSTGLLTGTRRIDAVMTEGGTVSGIVYRRPGEPLTRGSVRVLGWDDHPYAVSATIGAGGEFKLEGLPDGSIAVVVASDDPDEAPSPVQYTRTGLADAALYMEPPEVDPMDGLPTDPAPAGS